MQAFIANIIVLLLVKLVDPIWDWWKNRQIMKKIAAENKKKGEAYERSTDSTVLDDFSKLP